MKRILLSAMLLIGTFGFTQAQISGGIKGGLNFANQEYSADGFSISPDARTAFHVGAFLAINFSDNLGLQPELLYSSKGSEFEFAGTTATAKYNYLDVPILLRYSINEMISLHAGPQISLLMSAEDDDGDDISEGVTGSDLGLSFGGQVDLPMGLVGGLRYNLGLSNIDDTDSGGEVKNRVFQIYVGYKLFGN
jgi:hypothetical protein